MARVVWLLFFVEVGGVFSIIGPLPSPIFHFAAKYVPLWLPHSPTETSLRILNQQQASSVSQHGLKTHIKLECFWSRTRRNTNMKKV